MRRVKLARGRPFFTPRLDKLPILGELHDAGVSVSTMSIGDEDVPIGSDHDVGRLIEGVWTVAGNSGLSQGHQDLAFRTELENLLTFSIFPLSVGDPHISFLIHEDAVRKYEQPRTEALEQLARRIKLENWREVGAGAGIRATSLGHPDAAVRTDIYGTRRSPCPPLRKLGPVLDRMIRVGLGVEGCVNLSNGSRCCSSYRDSDHQHESHLTCNWHQSASCRNALNIVLVHFNSATGTSKTAVFTMPLRWNCTQIL